MTTFVNQRLVGIDVDGILKLARWMTTFVNQRLVGIDVDGILKLARWMTTFVNQRWELRDNCCHNLT